MAREMKLGEQAYQQERVEDQLAWFEKKSAWNQARYKRYKLLVIVLSVSIPLMVGFTSDEREWLKITIGVAGVLIALFEGVLSLYKYQDNWIQYRSTAEALKRESFLYKTGSGEYQGQQDPFPHYVKRIEAIIANDASSWKQYIAKEENLPKA